MTSTYVRCDRTFEQNMLLAIIYLCYSSSLYLIVLPLNMILLCYIHNYYLSRSLTAQPSIVLPPPSEVMVNQGETVVIECEAVGVPAPLIVWRLNWGHIGSQTRTVSNVETLHQGFGEIGAAKSRGILTIDNARKEDEGAYTCEAINAKGSILAVPDAIVHIISE